MGSQRVGHDWATSLSFPHHPCHAIGLFGDSSGPCAGHPDFLGGDSHQLLPQAVDTQLLIAVMGLKELYPSRARALAGAEGGGQAPLPTSRHCCCHCFLASPLHFQIPGVSWGSKPSPLLTFRMSSLGSLSFNSRPLPSPFCEPVTCDPISVLLQLWALLPHDLQPRSIQMLLWHFSLLHWEFPPFFSYPHFNTCLHLEKLVH